MFATGESNTSLRMLIYQAMDGETSMKQAGVTMWCSSDMTSQQNRTVNIEIAEPLLLWYCGIRLPLKSCYVLFCVNC